MGVAKEIVHAKARSSYGDEDLITGITEGLEDFAAGRCKRFKTPEEMIDYLHNV